MLMFGISAIHMQSYAQSYVSETVVGSVSGRQDAGEVYDLYKSSADSFREYLAGWKFVGERDKRVTYSESQLYEICMNEAKRQYGRYYSNLYLKDFYYSIKEEPLDDEEYYSQQVGSSTQYRKKERRKRVYIYSATVVSAQ